MKDCIEGTQTLHRGFALIRCLRDNKGLTLTEISKTLSLQTPTAHRLIKALLIEKAIKRDGKKYYANVKLER